ncbi:MAG: DEAD/DEAH box helicase [Microbacteriaceae bacterium]|nr:DEAD/DEAH box helicase [Microbacteriaceae bacterium]
MLARHARELEKAATKGKLNASNRTRYLVLARLMREEKAKVATLGEAEKAETLKRLDGLAAILAKTAALDISLITLLESADPLSSSAQKLRRDLLLEAGNELAPDDLIIIEDKPETDPLAEKQVVPPSVVRREQANPFMPPIFPQKKGDESGSGILANWEMLTPLYRAFEMGAGGGTSTMSLPDAPEIDRFAPPGRAVMKHQAQVLESVRLGHRAFLLADEPGLGKTATSLLSASVAGAYPFLAVVPNVVKTNWLREAEIWTPDRKATVIHGDGDEVDAFADIFIINYDILDRHFGWLSKLGFKGMVIDEAHFIKNRDSQRSQHVLALADHIRETQSITEDIYGKPNRPLMIALTGTPLINDVEDFGPIWQFLGWIDEKKPKTKLMHALEENGLTPADRGFLPEARKTVIELGIVRRKKIDVAKDIPARQVADMPVELEGELGRSIVQAELELAARLNAKFQKLRAAQPDADIEALILQVADSELEDSRAAGDGQNVFALMRKIGQAKAELAADYTAQLARSVGKVVFFAKHIDVMDIAEDVLAKRGLKTISIRGDQTPKQRQSQIDEFLNDPEVSVAVCSLTAAGVGLNLQVASNVVLAELSWTAAEQEQAIDRVHRIGQEEPVTAWRILASQTIDVKIAELIDSKAGLAARALDGAQFDKEESGSVQRDALAAVLRDTLGLTKR